MDNFVNGAKVRRIPSCRHIFHDHCLMKWLGGGQQVDNQKCPMCNSDITIEILEKAIEEDEAKKVQSLPESKDKNAKKDKKKEKIEKAKA